MAGEQANQSALTATVSDDNYGAQGACLTDKIYFDVPFEQKDDAKAAGLRWDSAARKWYAVSAEIASAFARPVATGAGKAEQNDRHYFKVPFLQKDRAKAMGMRFDGKRKLWFAPSSTLAVDAARIFKRIVASMEDNG